MNIITDNSKQVDGILWDLNSNPKVITSLVISRSGMHIAGQPPTGVHLDTFVAMMAILLSAAESASSGLKGELGNVFIELDKSRIIIESVSNNVILVVVTNTQDNHDSLSELIRKAIRNLVSVL